MTPAAQPLRSLPLGDTNPAAVCDGDVCWLPDEADVPAAVAESQGAGVTQVTGDGPDGWGATQRGHDDLHP